MSIFTKTRKQSEQERNQITAYLAKNPVTKPGGKKPVSLGVRTDEAIETSTLTGRRKFRDPVTPNKGLVTSYASTLIILYQGQKMMGKELPIAPTQLHETLGHYGLVAKEQRHGGSFFITLKGKQYIEQWLPIIIDTIIVKGTEEGYLEKEKLKNHPMIKRHLIPFLDGLIKARKEEIATTGEEMKTKTDGELGTYQVRITHSDGTETIIHKEKKEKAIALEIYENLKLGGANVYFELV